MSSQDLKPARLSSLAPSCDGGVVSLNGTVCKPNRMLLFWVGVVIWFIVIGLIAGLLLWVTKPPGIQTYDEAGEPTGEIDIGKIVWISIVIGLIAAIIYAFVKARRMD
jgi:hypothetical protein